jgi:dTDP-4-dehydrorhamnose reductase
MRYQRLLEAENSISQLDDFVSACWQTWMLRAPFGIYNVTNTGHVTTRQVVDMIQKRLAPKQTFEFFSSEEEFMTKAAKTPRSNCVMDNSKLLSAGVKISDVESAIDRSLANWISQSK